MLIFVLEGFQFACICKCSLHIYICNVNMYIFTYVHKHQMLLGKKLAWKMKCGHPSGHNCQITRVQWYYVQIIFITFTLSFREQPIFSTRAHVFQIDPNTKKNWVPTSKHAVTVSYFYDSTRNVYRIISLDGAKVSFISENLFASSILIYFLDWCSSCIFSNALSLSE